MTKIHTYTLKVEWTGNQGQGTPSYTGYSRSHVIRMDGKADIAGSADPAFRGDPTRHNPEDLLVASISSCHMLWYLHFCAVSKITVESYVDDPVGEMVVDSTGLGKFTSVVLKPRVKISSGDEKLALDLHQKAHEFCFIANSVNFPVTVEGSMLN